MVAKISVAIKDNRLPSLMVTAPQRAGQLIRVLANEGRNKAIMLIHESPATGRTYTRGTIQHTASSPGNPPRSDTASLVNSINVENAGPFSQSINVGVAHGELMEFGTDTIEPRPFMGPMALWLEGQVPDVFDKFLE